jgi:hypothetical protein
MNFGPDSQGRRSTRAVLILGFDDAISATGKGNPNSSFENVTRYVGMASSLRMLGSEQLLTLRSGI